MLLFLLILISCESKENDTLKSFKVNNGWGYSITMNNKTIIKQTVIPTISNEKSFKSEEDALKVGNLVLGRIKQHVSPTVLKKDLILLKIAL